MEGSTQASSEKIPVQNVVTGQISGNLYILLCIFSHHLNDHHNDIQVYDFSAGYLRNIRSRCSKIYLFIWTISF